MGPGWVLIMAGSLTDHPLPDQVVTSEQFWQENCSPPFRRLPSTPGTGHRPPGTLLSPPSPWVRTQVSSTGSQSMVPGPLACMKNIES